MLRQNQRALGRAMRELDREKMKLEQQEKKIIADIKKMAKQGQMVWTKAMTCVLEKKNLNCEERCSTPCRTLSKSWPKIWFAHGATSRSSSWWKPTFKLSVWRYRRWSPTTAWHRLWKGSPKPWPQWTDRSDTKITGTCRSIGNKCKKPLVLTSLCFHSWNYLRFRRLWWSLKSRVKSWKWRRRWWMTPSTMPWVTMTTRRRRKNISLFR